MRELIDLSQPITADMPVYPGDEPTGLVQRRFLDTDGYNDHLLTMGMHAGTHVDTPLHMLSESACVSELGLGSFLARGCLLDVRGQSLVSWRPEYDSLVSEGSILLLYTGHDRHYGSDRYFEQHPLVDLGFCDFLVQKQVLMLGMDLPSPDQPPFPVHQRLLANGVYILENLTNLGELLTVPRFEVIALPLKLRANSSPVRAVARAL